MSNFAFEKGLVEIARGAHAYLQPAGNWGYSNAGLVRDADQSLLVDTLFDERLTHELLAALASVGCKAEAIGTLINTHANGDHTNGNALVPNAEIWASAVSAKEMGDLPVAALAAIKLAGERGDLGEGGRYFAEIFGPFDFAGSRGKPPTKTFSGRHTLAVGDKPVHLIEVGPAHTAGDVLVHSPKDKVIFTGDILFIDCTPIMWAGPVQNWLRACDLIVDLDVDAIVPGHGPITDKAGVRKVAEYLRFVEREAKQRFDAGMSSEDAALDIALGEYDSWGDAERIAVNVDTCYRSWRTQKAPANPLELFTRMARIYAARKQRTQASP